MTPDDMERLSAKWRGRIASWVRRRFEVFANDADEIVQDVLVIAWRRGTLSDTSDPAAWLRGVTRNVCLRRLWRGKSLCRGGAYKIISLDDPLSSSADDTRKVGDLVPESASLEMAALWEMERRRVEIKEERVRHARALHEQRKRRWAEQRRARKYRAQAPPNATVLQLIAAEWHSRHGYLKTYREGAAR